MFNSIVCCSCGLCCSKDNLCEQCEIHTLRANGLPEELRPQITGLSKRSNWVRGDFEFSALYDKIRELSKKHIENLSSGSDCQ